MNTEKNKKIWLKKCETTLKLGGRSDITVRNYSYAIKRFLNSYDILLESVNYLLMI